MNEKKSLKQQLRQTQLAYQSALEMSQFKSAYLGRIAHELRSPISSLMSLHQLILSDLCDNREEEREFVGKAYECAEKLIGLIDQVVEISQIESGRIELDLKPLSLTNVLAQVYSRSYLQVINRNLELIIPDLDSQLYVMADEQKLLQALVNLIDATISSAETGSIIIRVSPSASEKWLTIKMETPVAINIWQESVDLKTPTEEDIKQSFTPPHFSPATKIILSKTLLEIMGGQLKVKELSPSNQTDGLTSLECLLPFVEIH